VAGRAAGGDLERSAGRRRGQEVHEPEESAVVRIWTAIQKLAPKAGAQPPVWAEEGADPPPSHPKAVCPRAGPSGKELGLTRSAGGH
jgi:hypothetical protein